MQIFLGTVNYYNRFIKDFSRIAYPLRKIAKDKKSFQWTTECNEAYEELRKRMISAPVMAYPMEEGMYILDTDASAFAIGAVLSQLQQDDAELKDTDKPVVERVIAYGSRSLQGREQRYCTRRRELLAIVEFVKHFKPYLWGREVLIRTDHASLKYIKTQNNPDDQFARWVERLEEVRYTIEIRKGVKHCNADGLSRLPSTTCAGKRCICPGVDALEAGGDAGDDYHYLGNIANVDVNVRTVTLCEHDDAGLHGAAVGEVSSAGAHYDTSDSEAEAQLSQTVEVNAFSFTRSWISDEIAVAQETDADVGPVYAAKAASKLKPSPNEYSGESAETKSYMHDWERLELKVSGILYRRWESDDGTEVRYQILLPLVYREDIYKHLHESKIACHMGKRRTMHRLQMRYFWYRMADDVKLWIQTCVVCQMRKGAGRPAKAPLTIYLSGMPNERVALDVLGPMKQSAAGNLCILVMTDHFSKYTKAIAMPNQQARTVADVFDREWVSVFGAPRIVHTDQGSNFESDVFQEMCKMLQIEKSRTTSYHPQGNSQCERFNSTLLAMIHAHARDHKDEWDRNLHHVMLFYNSTKHSTTGIEPNRIMFGRNVDMPIDITMPVDPSVQPMTPNEYVRNLERKLRAAYTSTREHLKRAATAQKRYYDRDSHLYKYKEGDMIKLRRFKKEPGTGKFSDRYEGPYFVLDVLGDVTFRIIKCKESKPRVVHHDHILPYFPKEAAENVDKTWVFEKSRTYKPTTKDDATCQTSDSCFAQENLSVASHVEPGHQELLEVAPADTSLFSDEETNPSVGVDNNSQPTRKQVKIRTTFSDVAEIPKRKRGRPRKVPSNTQSVTPTDIDIVGVKSAEVMSGAT